MSHAGVADHVKRLLILLVLVVTPMMQAFAQPSSVPERRVAFVIGIGAYKNAPRLPNPVSDARAIGDSSVASISRSRKSTTRTSAS